jgi:pimeloyl-ACP methyl ester carboxylesterase
MNEPVKRIKGAKDLVFDAVEETTNLVEQMHALTANISVRPLTLIAPLTTLTLAVKTVHDATASGVYEMIRMVNRSVKKLLDAGSDLVINGLVPHGRVTDGLTADQAALPGNMANTGTSVQKYGDFSCRAPESKKSSSPDFLIDQSEAILNGLYGDYLNKKGNSLDLGMTFRHRGKILPIKKDAMARAFPDATARICVFIHGLMCTEQAWNIGAEKFYADLTVNFGSQLKADLGYTPLFVRYNTGRHISENGRMFSELLSQLADEYPVDIEEIVLVGHSMGGLVSRSAAHYGHAGHASWTGKLKHICCIGSPNLGAPLEKAVNLMGSLLSAFNTAGTKAPAQILKSRSVGIKDLRFGYTTDDEWMDKNPDAFLQDNRRNLPLLDGVGYSFIAATVTADPNHPIGVLIGDIMVRVPSAAGHTADPEQRIPFHSGLVFAGMNHLHMANHPDVYNVIREFLTTA